MTPDLVQAACDALAAALPGPADLAAGAPVPASSFASPPAFLLPDDPGASVVARFGEVAGATVTGEVAVVVGADLVEALATSPLGALDLTAAVQSALDAAAAAVGGGAAAASQQLDVEVALDSLLGRPGAHLVPLAGPDGLVVASVVLALTEVAPAGPTFVPTDEPAPVAAETVTVPTQVAPQVHLPQQGAAPAAGSAGAGAAGFPAGSGLATGSAAGLDLLRDVAMEVTVELGRTRMTVRELLSLSPGAVVELDRAAGSPADLLVNGTLIARGEIVVVDEDFGIRITEIVAPGADGGTAAVGVPGVPAGAGRGTA